MVLVDGACVLYVERGGKTLLSFSQDENALSLAAQSLAASARNGALGKLHVESADGAAVVNSPLGQRPGAGRLPTQPAGLRLRGGAGT